MAAQNWREYFDDKLADERSLRLQHSDNSTLISSEATDIDTVIEILYGDGAGTFTTSCSGTRSHRVGPR